MIALSIFKDSLSIFAIFAGIIIFFLLKEKKAPWIFFSAFLITLGTLDQLGGKIPSDYNLLFYNYLVIPGEFLFYYWLFSNDERLGKKLPIYIALGYFVAFGFEKTGNTSNYGLQFGSFSYTIGIIGLLVLIIRYLYLLSNSDDILHFKSQPMFWISVGLLVFWLGSLPYYGLLNYLYQNFPQLFSSYTWVAMVLNYLMYSLFICAFLWQKEK